MMEICDLMTLSKGLRVKSTPTAENPRGYTDGSDVLHQEDIVRLDDLFQQVDPVTCAPLSDIYKLSYFMCHFQHDPHPMVPSRI